MLTACELQQPVVAVMWGRRGTGLCCSLWVLPGLPSPSLTCCSLSLEASHCAEWKASVYLEQVGICCCTSSFCHFQPQGFSSSVFVVPGCAGGSGWVLRTISNPKSSWVLAQLHREFGVTIPGVDRSCGDGALGAVVGGHCGDGDLKSFPTLMVLCETCWSGDVMFPKVPRCDCRDGQQCV